MEGDNIGSVAGEEISPDAFEELFRRLREGRDSAAGKRGAPAPDMPTWTPDDEERGGRPSPGIELRSWPVDVDVGLSDATRKTLDSLVRLVEELRGQVTTVNAKVDAIMAFLEAGRWPVALTTL